MSIHFIVPLVIPIPVEYLRWLATICMLADPPCSWRAHASCRRDTRRGGQRPAVLTAFSDDDYRFTIDARTVSHCGDQTDKYDGRHISF